MECGAPRPGSAPASTTGSAPPAHTAGRRVMTILFGDEEACALRIPVREFYESIGATRWLRDLDSTQEK